MFRKPSGGIGVSFTRFLNNAMPSIMYGSVKDPGHISIPQKDMFYSHQISSNNPFSFDELSLLQSGILDNESISKKGFKKLQKIGVLDHEGCVDTLKIGPNFTHDMATISAVRQKQIIDLLFWWEEECQRLRKLQCEQAELYTLVEGARSEGVMQDIEQMTALLDRVNLKIRQRPSQRIEAMEKDEDEIMVKYQKNLAVDNELPAYSA